MNSEFRSIYAVLTWKDRHIQAWLCI